MKGIAIVTMAFLPLATIAVRKPPTPSHTKTTTLTKHAGSLRLSILQLRPRKQEDSSRGGFLDLLGPHRRAEPRGLAAILLPILFAGYE